MAETESELKAAQLTLEREKFEEETRNNARIREFEEMKFAAEQSRSKWVQLSTQLSVVIPVVTLLIGAAVARISDNQKRDRDSQQEIEKTDRAFIHRQLSELYYPIEVRLQQDDDTWHLAFPQVNDPTGLKSLVHAHPQFSTYVQQKLLIANHDQILQLLEGHGDLIENGIESPSSREHVDALLKAISQYREHVALYKALTDNHLNMTPADIDAQDAQNRGKFRYPDELEARIKDRIHDLYQQLNLLGEAPPSGLWLGKH